MKKSLNVLLAIILITTIAITGCQSKSENDKVIVVGASPEPHAQMLELIADDLAKEGYELKIVEFTDYVKPNLALDEKELDANFFQHLPYLEDFNEKNSLDLVSLASTHIEPMGLYSKQIDNIDELNDGAEIAIPNDTVNGSRALLFLEDKGLIELKEGAGFSATEKDIVKNPKNLKFKLLEAALLPRALDEVDAAAINGNYALQANLSPSKDAILLERSDSPYANIVAIRKGEENSPKLKALVKALQSDKIKNFIKEKYGDGVVPSF
ncbi:MetQ/NlpA family ABC transporter substrate-binding protein [Proteiniborus sp. MB09-C3]|uniref:MetQ/NlpA family ABC transporter substrate-binding protein n=1 Tax=Proteiniborus sp. MB09-C3 TaxID=3050072 RepID=UPI002555855D|nr:MetQ/NlpA family ABC transporter substrate-binding protein [Proteiniborus sp. MB09-C3]WIV11477.1 MetQ/NlpA family ABC transporter substrate-binding protein [Proteiniborus sp. MB09-C3]